MGKLKQLKQMANQVIEDGTKSILRGMHGRKFSIQSSGDRNYQNSQSRQNSPVPPLPLSSEF
jgi:hypothetical protein